jgi:hypothetical protein
MMAGIVFSFFTEACFSFRGRWRRHRYRVWLWCVRGVRADACGQFIYLENIGPVDLVLHRVFVHADNDLFVSFDRFLILIRRFLYLTLREAGLDRLDHSAEAIDLVKVIVTAFDHFSVSDSTK